jgi:hypothetical protein
MRKRTALPGICVAYGFLLSWSGCKACSSPPVESEAAGPALGKVVVRVPGKRTLKGREVLLDEQRLRDKVREVLLGSKVFSVQSEGRATANVSVAAEPLAVDSAESRDIGVRVRLRISIHPESPKGSRFEEDVAAMGQTQLVEGGDVDPGGVFERLAERTAEDLARGYVRRQKLWTSNPADLRAPLVSDDVDVRLEAIRVVGARKLHALAGDIEKLLSDDDEDIRDAALGALVAMQERSAIKALADSHQMRDTREMRKVIDAIAALGGREAFEYLTFVAETHDDDEIREMAKSALKHLSKDASNVRPTK